MLWCNHRLVSASIAFGLTGQLVPTILAYKGSTIPDQVEGSDYENPAWAARHRKHSHYWVFYLIPLVLCMIWMNYHLTLPLTYQGIAHMIFTDQTGTLVLFTIYAIQWLAIGGLMHIAEDFFCGGVPGLTIANRVGLRIFYVGDPQEYYIASVITAVCCLARLFFANEFFMGI